MLDAIILAGGRSSRLGGSPKAELVIGSRRLVDIAVDAAAAADARRTVVVGPDDLVAAPLITTREQPPFGGPVAGLAAGLAALDRLDADAGASDRDDSADAATAHAQTGADRWVLVLTCDLPLAAKPRPNSSPQRAAQPVRCTASASTTDGRSGCPPSTVAKRSPGRSSHSATRTAHRCARSRRT